MSEIRIASLLPVSAALLFGFLLMAPGCETLQDSGIPGLRPDTSKLKEAAQTEQEYRERFLLDRDHKSLYWLVGHRIKNGMPVADVERILGEPGELETETSKLQLGSLYQTTDLVYKWGPDSSGYSVVLIFRDGHLVNFDPTSFRAD